MRKTFLSFFAALILSAASILSLSGAEFVLVKNGKCEVVLVRENAILKQQKILVNELKKCKVTLPIVTKEQAKNSKKILFKLQKQPLSREDAFTIDFPDRNTMRITSTEVSARWAINHLLQKVFKVVHLFPHLKEYGKGDVNIYPEAKNITIAAKKFTKGPHSFYLYRTVDWHYREFMAFFGSKSTFIGTHFIPVDVFPVWKYAPNQSWPKEILPILRGKKYIPPKPKKLPLSKNPYIAKKGYDVHWNPCFTNPATTKIAIENILEIMKKNPGKLEIYMGLNDNGGMCQCPNCRKAAGSKRNSNGYEDWSIPYWSWVNNVAKAVSPRYPNVWFVASSYREAMDPPPFKLHKQIAVKLCFEIYGMTNKATEKKRLALMKNWAKSCQNLIFYDYSYGNHHYILPRFTPSHQSETLKKFYKEYNLRGMSQEASVTTAFEGPKHVLTFRLMENIHIDPWKVVQEWCEKAVGKKAAKPLMEYYTFWEKYWMGEDIRKTLWYKTSSNIYLQLGERSTHTFALKKGDMAYLRSLMEKVVALAGTPGEKRRAKILMQYFELSELGVKALFSEYISPESKISSPRDAVALLKEIPAAFDALQKLENHPLKRYAPQGLKGNMLSNLGLIMPYIREPAVRKELDKLSRNPKVDHLLRCQLKIWLGAKAKNLIQNGSFEDAKPIPKAWGGGGQGSRRNAQFAFDGKYSLGKKAHISIEFSQKVTEGKTYLFIFSAFTPKGSAEGRLNYMITPRSGRSNRDHIRYLNISLPGGKWQTYVGSYTVRKGRKIDNMVINIWTNKYEKDELILIDNAQLYCLDDLKM